MVRRKNPGVSVAYGVCKPSSRLKLDSGTTQCVSVDGKGRARTVVVGAAVSGGDRGDDGGGDGGDDGGGEGGEDGGGQGSSDGEGAVHRWLRQTETAEAAPATGLQEWPSRTEWPRTPALLACSSYASHAW